MDRVTGLRRYLPDPSLRSQSLCGSTALFRIKSFTARTIIDYLEEKKVLMLLRQMAYYKWRYKRNSTYQLWQEGAHTEEILDEEMMRQKLEYIHDNPVKRGYVDDPCHWRYSSARNYAGQEGLVEVVTDW
jgi:putative transposase